MEELQNQVNALQKVVNNLIANLNNSSSFPYGLEAAIRERIRQPIFFPVTLDFPSTTPLSRSTLTISVPDTIPGDPVVLGIPDGSTASNTTFAAWVNTAGTVTIAFDNNNAVGNVNPNSGEFVIAVLKQ